MLTPEEVDRLTAEYIQKTNIPLAIGDRIEVAKQTIAATIAGLAPRVTLDKKSEGGEPPATPAPSDGKPAE
jgi:hypothetical protein